jgi:trimeric autotransporter adhesin
MGKPRRKINNMAKNMTFKGLAFGAVAALGFTGLSALPAQAVGIANDLVVINDTKEYGNYNMLTTGYIDIDGSFAFAAQSGGELKFHVSDPSAISKFDVDPEGASDTITLNGTAIALMSAFHSAAGDIVTLQHAVDGTAHGVEVGDAILIAGVADSNFTVADINGYQTVTRVTALGLTTAGNAVAATAAAAVSPATLDTITLTLSSTAGLQAGDVITVALGAGSAGGAGTGTLADTEMEGSFVVQSIVSATQLTYLAATGITAGADSWTESGAGTVVSDGISFVPGTEVTTSTIQADALDTNGTVTEASSSTALDALGAVRAAAFGAVGAVGVATARSVAAGTVGNYVVDTNEEDASAGDQIARFVSASATTGGSIVVTAWIDTDDDGVIDSTENVSDSVTVTFVVPSAASFSIAQENVYITSDSVTAVVTGDFNLAEIGAQQLLEIGIDHNDAGTTVAETNAALAYDATDENLQGSDTNLTNNLAAGDSIKFSIEDKINANAVIGATSSFGVGSLTVAGSILSVPVTISNSAGYNLDADGTAMASQAVNVRTGTASVAGTLTVYTGDPTVVASRVVVPNTLYTISITSSAVTAADGVKFNGKVVDGGTEVITGYTDASGQIALSLTQTAADASDVVTVEIDVQGLDKTALMAFTYAVSDYNLYDSAGELSASTDWGTTSAVGGTVTRSYKVADQFGAAPANGAVVVTATSVGSRVTTAATWSYQVPVVDGVATVAIADNGVGTGSEAVTLKTYPVLVGGGLGAEHDSNTYTITYAATAADVTPSAVTAVVSHDGIDDALTNDQPVALEPDALVNHDARASNGVAAPAYDTNNVDTTSPANGVDTGLTLSGTVSNATGGVIPGALVTITGTGVGFKFTTTGTSLDIYGRDSITVRTGAAGTYSVEVYGGTGGLKTLSVTAGAATASDTVTFAAGGAVSAFTLTTPGASEPGKTVDVFINLTDAYGNPVQGATVTLSSTGPGYLLNTTGTTLATGKYSTKLLVGSNDSGTAVISATVTIAGVATTKTSSIVIGVGAVAASEQKVNVGSFKGYVALYAKGYKGKKMSAIVAGKWIVVASLASDFERVVRYTGAGYDIVTTIYIDGVSVQSFNVTTK